MEKMFFSGFADEAASGIDGQIRATRELGWKCIEARNVDGMNIHDLPEEAFEEVAAKLDQAGIRVNCFGSTVANWGCDPFSDEDFRRSVETLERAIGRMKRLGCKMIRGMSFTMQKKRSPFDREVEQQVFPKVKTLVQICSENGIIYGHENCMNFGGQSYEHTLRLIEAVDMPDFKLIFDTGNPVFTDLRLEEPPYPKQSSWYFYRQVREFIAYVHIKDGIFRRDTENIFPEVEFTYPGEGHGDVRKILADLIRNGYNGGISIEPHLAKVFHESGKPDENAMFSSYVEYGRRLMKIIDEIKAQPNTQAKESEK